MGNFFTENNDMQFQFRHLNLDRLAAMCEEDFSFSRKFDHAPVDAEEAVRNYYMVLESLGQLSADFIEPRAEDVDRTGNVLNEDGSVGYAPPMLQCLEKLAKAQVMGFTLPHRFGGLNFPNLVYSMAIEVVSRADAAIMNIFGLQGIAETINAFASEKIKDKYLHRFAAGDVTGAMVLTEPDAGSDLQSVKLRAFADSGGNWYLHGVKRFITNGCGDVLLVLARSESDRAGGLGLSLFVCDKGPTVHIRRLEDKLGIHGSPTCEIFFDNTPCELIGERQRGLVTYVMSLMNGARIGIAAQSMGIAEAALGTAREYAATRKQFAVAIEKLPAVADMLIDMQIDIEAGRSLLYEASRVVDMEIGYNRMLDSGRIQDKQQQTQIKSELRKYKRYAAMLTPMSKYFCSEMCNRVAYDAMQILGGSGYMRDYPCERYYRDARITTIYEGTSQLQIVAAVRGVCSGTFEKLLAELATETAEDRFGNLTEKLEASRKHIVECVASIKEQGPEFMDLYGRRLVDMAVDTIIGHLFLLQASSASSEVEEAARRRKAAVAGRFISRTAPKIASSARIIAEGDKSTFTDFEAFVGKTSRQ